MNEIKIATNKSLSPKDEAKLITLVQDFLKNTSNPAEELREDTFKQLSNYYENEFYGDYGYMIPFKDFLSSISGFTLPIKEGIVFGLLLKVASAILNKKHKDHIKSNDSVYFVSTLDGKVKSVDYGSIANPMAITFFRTKEDAELAIEAFKDRYDAIFSEESEEEE